MTDRDRRAVVWGAAVIVGTLLVVRVVPVVARQYSALQTHAQERVGTLIRAREAVAGRQAMQDSLSRLGARVVGLAPKLIAVGSAADAAAELSGAVSSLAGRHDVRVVQVESVPDSGSGRLGQVAVRADVEGDITGLTGFLGQIEADEHVLSLSSWALNASEGAMAGGSERLRAQVEIRGWYVRRERP